MSKSRGKPQRSGDKTADSRAVKAAEADELGDGLALQWGITAVAAAAILAYLFLFFCQNLAPNAAPSRFALFAYLLTPDDLAKDWVEGSWRNFSIADRAPVAALAFCSLAIALTVGILVLMLSRVIDKTTRLEQYVFRVGAGFQVVSLSVLFSGLVGHGYSVGAIMLVILIAIAFGLFGIFRLINGRSEKRETVIDIHPPVPAIFSKETAARSTITLAAEYALTCLLVVLSVLILLGAMLPPWDFDVREYHLQVPKEWAQQGKVAFLPHNIYGNMPLGAEMNALTAFQFALPLGVFSLATKLVIASFGPLTALLLYAAGRRYCSRIAGLVAAAIYLSSPWVIHICVNGLNDAALGFYFLAALFAAFLGDKGRPCSGLSGFFAGAAAAVKYTGVVFVVFPLFLLMLWHQFAWKWRCDAEPVEDSIGSPRVWRAYPMVFLLMAALSSCLWYGKNLAFTGNPVYPLMGDTLGGTTRTPEKIERWNEAHKPPEYTIKELAKSAASVGWKDQFQSPLMVPLTGLGIAALAIAAGNRNRKTAPHSTLRSALFTPHSVHVLTVTAILLLFFLAAWWLFTHRLERFLVPAIPLAALLAGAGVEYVRNKPLKYVAAGLMVIGLTYNLLMAASPLVGDNRWFVSLERLQTDEPKRDQDQSRVTPAIRWLNEHAKPDDAVLCVGEAAVFDLEMPVFYNTCFDDCLLVNWTENKTAAERKEELRSRKIAYVYFDESEIRRYRSDDNYGYDPRFDAKLFDELVRQGVLQQPLPGAPPKIYPVVP